jgi:hypothetical protein
VRQYLEEVIDVVDAAATTDGILTHATFADPEAGIDLLERLLESPDVVEDLLFVGCLHAPFEQDFPQYWEPLLY